MTREDQMQAALSKVPAVTLGFWVIKILATTLGETGADLFTQQYKMGYLAGIGLFLTPLVLLVAAQIRARRFHPLLYWGTIIASTTAGTALADFFDRDLGIGYAGGSAVLLACVVASLAAWRLTLGTVSVASVSEPRAEIFYWVTITFSQTLGTALGDWTADETPLGYLGSAALFGALLAIIALLYWKTAISRVALFWAAFILTRPLGATVGDFLDKPLAQGGLDLGRDMATLVLVVAIALCLWRIPQRAGAAH
ncbi:MAG: membrane protein [Novosphingobium sp.]